MSNGAAKGHTGCLKPLKTLVNMLWQEFEVDMMLFGSMLEKHAPVADCILVSRGRHCCKAAGYVHSLFCITNEAVACLDL